MEKKGKILIVDDDINICEILTYMLSNNGYEVTAVNSAEEAMSLLNKEHNYSLILLDVMMGALSGYQMAETSLSKR